MTCTNERHTCVAEISLLSAVSIPSTLHQFDAPRIHDTVQTTCSAVKPRNKSIVLLINEAKLQKNIPTPLVYSVPLSLVPPPAHGWLQLTKHPKPTQNTNPCANLPPAVQKQIILYRLLFLLESFSEDLRGVLAAWLFLLGRPRGDALARLFRCSFDDDFTEDGPPPDIPPPPCGSEPPLPPLPLLVFGRPLPGVLPPCASLSFLSFSFSASSLLAGDVTDPRENRRSSTRTVRAALRFSGVAVVP